MSKRLNIEKNKTRPDSKIAGETRDLRNSPPVNFIEVSLQDFKN
jgi:hypothetical protein